MRQAKIEEQYFTIDQFETDYVLPEGWAAGVLEELIGRGGILTDGDWIESKDQDPHGDVRLIQLADIGDGYYKDKSSRFLTSEKAKELGCTFLEKGDVLVARMPEPLGRTCIFPGDPKPAVTAVDICIIRTGDDSADHRWIMQTVNSPEIRRRIESLQKGTTRKRISRRNLASLTLPIPPFNEQRRIAAKVEELLARVNATKDRLAKVSMILKRFRQAVLAAACSGRLTANWRDGHQDVEPASIYLERFLVKRRKRWETARTEKKKQTYVEPLALEVRNGAELPETWCWSSIGQCFFADSGEAFKKCNYSNNGLRLFQIANVGFGKTVWEQRNYLPEPFMKSYPELILEVGDICMALNRPILGDNLKVARISADDLPAILYQRVACLRAVEQPVGDFAFLYMLSDRFREFVQDNLQGTDQPYLNFSLLPKFPLPLPPILEQQEIVRRVESMFKLADAIEKRVAAATARAEKLTQAILAKAFRGELVPTEAELARRDARSYESASELLARIKSARDSKRSPESVNRIRGPRKRMK